MIDKAEKQRAMKEGLVVGVILNKNSYLPKTEFRLQETAGQSNRLGQSVLEVAGISLEVEASSSTDNE